MFRLRALVVLLLVVGFTPGLPELIKDAAHGVLEGHSPHGANHQDEDIDGSEHCCSDEQLECTCHTSPNFLTVVALRVPLAVAGLQAPLALPHRQGPDGVRLDIRRPPRT